MEGRYFNHYTTRPLCIYGIIIVFHLGKEIELYLQTIFLRDENKDERKRTGRIYWTVLIWRNESRKINFLAEKGVLGRPRQCIITL